MSNQLVEILKFLHRGAYSINQISDRFGATKSAMQKLLSNLFSLNLVQYANGLEPEKKSEKLGFPIEIVKDRQRCSILVTQSFKSFSASLYCYGDKNAIATKMLSPTDDVNNFVNQLDICTNDFIRDFLKSKNEIKSITIIAPCIVEQGENGIMWRNDYLKDKCVNLSELVKNKTSVRCFVYSYIHEVIQDLISDQKVKYDNALIINSDTGILDLGILIEGKIVFGKRKIYPDFSYMPIVKDIQDRLCAQDVTEDSKQLFFSLIISFAHIYNPDHIIFTGKFFSNHPNFVDSLISMQQKSDDFAVKKLKFGIVSCFEQKLKTVMTEQSFDDCAVTLDPKVQKNSLADFISKNYDPSFVKELLR